MFSRSPAPSDPYGTGAGGAGAYPPSNPPPPPHHQHPATVSPRLGGVDPEDDRQVVNVNVGGTNFTTQLGTLRAHKGSALCTMFTPPFQLHQDARDGSFFIDRSGDVFGYILDYLRTGTLVVPRNPVEYASLRREVRYYGLPVALQLPQSRPVGWQEQPVRFKHARIVIDEIEKIVEWEEGQLPPDLHKRQVFDIVRFFTAKGYRLTSEYTSRGTKGFMSLWLVKEEAYPAADAPLEITNDDVAAAMAAAQQQYAQQQAQDRQQQEEAKAQQRQLQQQQQQGGGGSSQPRGPGSFGPTMSYNSGGGGGSSAAPSRGGGGYGGGNNSVSAASSGVNAARPYAGSGGGGGPYSSNNSGGYGATGTLPRVPSMSGVGTGGVPSSANRSTAQTPVQPGGTFFANMPQPATGGTSTPSYRPPSATGSVSGGGPGGGGGVL